MIENDNAREFYAQESVKSNWSVRQLERQIGTFYYERLLASQDKEAVSNEIGLPEKVEPKNNIENPIAPKIHNLILLSQKANLEVPEDLRKKIQVINTFNISARYDDYKENFRQKCTEFLNI